jgi:hypothetical protein
VGPGAGLDRCGKSRPTGIRSPDLPTRSESLYRLRYPGSLVVAAAAAVVVVVIIIVVVVGKEGFCNVRAVKHMSLCGQFNVADKV